MIVYGPPCMTHKKQHPVEIPDNAVPVYNKWYGGLVPVQEIPIPAADREILLTGTCGEVWDSMFADKECAEDCDGSSHPDKFCR